MDRWLLVTGLPVALALAASGLWLMSRGWTWGIGVLVLAVVTLMFTMGQGLPRPDVVPRPGEEDDY